MLIRILKKSKDLLEGKPHAPNSELSRRGFLQRGATGTASLLLMPSFVSMLRSEPAKAAAFACSFETVGTTYTQLHAAGGNGTTRMCFAWDMAGNALVGNSASLGTRTNDTVDSATIPGIYLNNNDVFAQCLKAGGAINANGVSTTALFSGAVTAEILSKLSGSQIACAKNDDTGENPINVMLLFGDKCGMRKGMLADVAGESAGSRSIDGLMNNFAVLKSGGSIQNLVNAASLQNNILTEPAMGTAMEKALNALTNEQKAKLAGQVGAEDFVKNITAGIASAKGKVDPTVADLALNPDNPANKAVFDTKAPIAALQGGDKMLQALVDAACRQQFGAVNIVEGGFDYHNGSNDAANSAHARLARFILVWAWVHVVRGKNGILQIDTDGGIGWDQTDPAPNALGDRGSSGQSLFIHVQGAAGTKPSFKRQGYYSGLISAGGGESASREPLVGKSPAMSSIACVLTYGLMTGALKTTDGSLQAFLDKINARGTLITSTTSLMSLSMMA
jgi:hypothetical protein